MVTALFTRHIGTRAVRGQTCWAVFGLPVLVLAAALVASAPVLTLAQEVTSDYPDVLKDVTLPIEAKLSFEKETGEVDFVPNMSFRDALQYKQQTEGTLGRPYTFQSIEIDAVVSGSHADVEATYRIELAKQVRSIEIPLQLGTCQLSGPPTIETLGVTDQFLADENGYRWLLMPEEGAGEGASVQQIRLNGKSRLMTESDRSVLRIALPLQPRCVVRVLLPASAVDPRVRNEDDFSSQLTDRGLEVTVTTRGGDFSLTWRSGETADSASSIVAVGNTTFQIQDPRQEWNASTTLTVRWFGASASNEFRVRLPEAARWRGYPTSVIGRYAIDRVAVPSATGVEQVNAPEGDPSTLAAPAPVELVIRNLDPAANQSISLALQWDWLPGGSGKAPVVVETSVPSLLVSGVDDHTGTVECVYGGAFSAIFNKGEGAGLIALRRLEDGSQSLKFSYRRQDFKLGVSIREEQGLPLVRPTYHVEVDENKLVLTAWLDCSFYNSAPGLNIGMDFGDWILQENTAKSLSNESEMFSDEGEDLRPRLQADNRTYIISGVDEEFGSRRVNQLWRLVAERSWTPDEDSLLQFDVPEIIRSGMGGVQERNHGSGTLIISAAENILLQWNDTRSSGLLTDSFSTEYEKFVRNTTARNPSVYRFQNSETIPTWSGRAELLPQVVAVEELVEVKVVDASCDVVQDFSLAIANSPVSPLRVAVEKTAGASEPLFFVDGDIVSAKLVGSRTGSSMLSELQPGAIDGLQSEESTNTSGLRVDVDAVWDIYELSGASPLLGSPLLTVRRAVAWEVVKSSSKDDQTGNDADPLESPVNFRVPLARPMWPRQTKLMRRQIRLQSELRVAIVGDEAAVSGLDAYAELKPLNLAVNGLELLVYPKQDLQRGVIRVEQSWLQTVLTNTERRDRFVAQIENSPSQINVRLPLEAAVRDLEVLLDGKRLRDAYDSETETVPINVPDQGRHTLEVVYNVRTAVGNLPTLSVMPPVIENASQYGRFYWQLATPSTLHLGSSPSVLAPEWRWRWSGIWWFRSSALDEPSLNRQLGASDIFNPLPMSANQYLMSGRFPDSGFRVWVIPRLMLWFPVGLVAIGVAALVINVPFFRKPLMGFALALVLASIGMVLPDLGVLLGQTAVISLGLVALVLTTQAAIESRVRRRSVFTSRPSTYLEGSGNFSLNRPAPAASTPIAVTDVVPKVESSVASGGGK